MYGFSDWLVSTPNLVDYVSLPQPVLVATEFVLQLPIGIVAAVVVVAIVVDVVVVATELVVGHLLLLETELVATVARIPEPSSPGLVAMAGLELELVERVRVIRRVVLERRRRAAMTTCGISCSRQKTWSQLVLT